MFKKPTVVHDGRHLRQDQFEDSQMYLSRTRRMLFLRGIIVGNPIRDDQFSATAVGDDIIALNMDDPVKPIYLLIDSLGGDITSGFILFDIIRMSHAPVITIGQSVSSMAVTILTAGSERLLFPHSRVMLHLPYGSIQGDPEEIEIRRRVIEDIKEELISIYIKAGATAGLDTTDARKIRKRILTDINKEKWLTAPEAVKYGLADRIVNSTDLFGKELT